MRVKPSGDPDRDDTGLPPVDVEIPDDARELDRDVQAYYRELRAERRHQRKIRMHGTLARDGMVVPLLVCCLIFALVTGTLLTLFTATSIDNGLPGTPVNDGHTTATGPARSGPASVPQPPRPIPLVRSATSELSPVPVGLAGHEHQLGQLGPAILLVQSPRCACDAAIRRLASLAAAAHAHAYLVVKPGDLAAARSQAATDGFGLQVASDVNASLIPAFAGAGLTAIMVDSQGAVSYAQTLQAAPNLSTVLTAAGV
jgi:hypothetical protein